MRANELMMSLDLKKDIENHSQPQKLGPNIPNLQSYAWWWPDMGLGIWKPFQQKKKILSYKWINSHYKDEIVWHNCLIFIVRIPISGKTVSISKRALKAYRSQSLDPICTLNGHQWIPALSLIKIQILYWHHNMGSCGIDDVIRLPPDVYAWRSNGIVRRYQNVVESAKLFQFLGGNIDVIDLGTVCNFCWLLGILSSDNVELACLEYFLIKMSKTGKTAVYNHD